MKIGYARCSTVAQDTEAQMLKLDKLSVDRKHVYLDHGFTGKTMTRSGYQSALKALRAGDEFVVPAMDRLARNARETLRAADELTEAGVVLNIGGVIYEPDSPMSRLFITILAAVAEAEGGWISLRTKEALAVPAVRAKLRGKQPKLKPSNDAAIVRHLESGDMTVVGIAAMFNTSRPSVYRAAARHRARIEAAGGAVSDQSPDEPSGPSGSDSVHDHTTTRSS